MAKTRKSYIKSLSSYEKISSACLALSLVANVYLGYSSHGLQTSNSAFEQKLKTAELRLKQRETEPRLLQEYVILPGNSFKAFTGIDWSKATIENGAHPEFVETSLGTEIYRFIEAEDAIRALKSFQVTFITIRNDGKSVAQNVMLVAEHGGENLLIGNIHPGTIKLIPMHFVRSQPQVEKTEPRRFTKYVYTVAGEDGLVQRETEVTARSEASWTPSLDTLRGVGRALVSSDNEHLFK
jgi:hypothetical protein